MPSIDAPTHYERANHIMLDRFDPFFRHAVNGESGVVATTGDTASPLGAVTLLNLTLADTRVISAEAGVGFSGYPSEGWYICRLNDDGLIWAMHYGGDYVFNEERARADFAEAEQVDAAWHEAEDQWDPEPDDYYSGTGELMSDTSYEDYLNR